MSKWTLQTTLTILLKIDLRATRHELLCLRLLYKRRERIMFLRWQYTCPYIYLTFIYELEFFFVSVEKKIILLQSERRLSMDGHSFLTSLSLLLTMSFESFRLCSWFIQQNGYSTGEFDGLTLHRSVLQSVFLQLSNCCWNTKYY